MNRSKQSKNGYTFDMLIFSRIRVKRREEKTEREREGSGGERRWKKR